MSRSGLKWGRLSQPCVEHNLSSLWRKSGRRLQSCGIGRSSPQAAGDCQDAHATTIIPPLIKATIDLWEKISLSRRIFFDLSPEDLKPSGIGTFRLLTGDRSLLNSRTTSR